MRKSGIFLIVLLVICLTGSGCILAKLADTQDDVEYEVKIAYGEAGAAEGLTVTELAAGFSGKMRWNMVCRLGEPTKVDTTYTFDSLYRDNNSYVEDKVQLELGGPEQAVFGTELSVDALYLGGLEKAIAEMADSVSPGTRKERDIRVSDYCEFYPWTIMLNIGNVFYSSGESVYDSDILYESGSSSEWEKKIYDSFQEKFQLPTPEDLMLGISVEKDEAGRLISYELEYMETGLYSVSLSHGDSCYFIINSGYEDMDLTQIPLGYGIYEIVYNENDSAEEVMEEAVKNIRCVYKFDAEENIVVDDLALSPDEKNLELLSCEQGTYYLSVIDLETWELRQKVEIGTGGYYFMRRDGNLILLYNEEELKLLVEQEDQDYEMISFSAALDAFPVGVKSEETIVDVLLSGCALAWDGTRLAVVSEYTDWNYEDEYASGWGETVDYSVCIFEQEGLCYMATYECSLNTLGHQDAVQNYLWEYGTPAILYWEQSDQIGLRGKFED